MRNWYLEGFVDDRREIWRTHLDHYPFRVGRDGSHSLTLPLPEVSGTHAEFVSRGDELWIHDLGSTNGTFVNGTRLSAAEPLKSGDIVRFATREFRVVAVQSTVQRGDQAGVSHTVVLETGHEAPNLLARLNEFREALAEDRLCAHLQAIVRLSDGETVGYESLGRAVGDDGGLMTPAFLFECAAGLECEAELSERLRAAGLRAMSELGKPLELFVNTHPAELADGIAPLLRSLDEAQQSHPEISVVLEIHEAAVASRPLLVELGQGIAERGMSLAFDDFGVGQARLLELAEVSPRYLKFDREWVAGVDRGSKQRLEMLAQLISLVKGLGIACLAEGVETEAEAATCRQLGFDYAQGYHYGRPQPPGDL